MKNTEEELIQTIFDNYDNLELCNITLRILNLLVDNLISINKLNEDDTIDMGNGYKLYREDYESICSILDTLQDIQFYNNNEVGESNE